MTNNSARIQAECMQLVRARIFVLVLAIAGQEGLNSTT
jgi:hypothetical protein